MTKTYVVQTSKSGKLQVTAPPSWTALRVRDAVQSPSGGWAAAPEPQAKWTAGTLEIQAEPGHAYEIEFTVSTPAVGTLGLAITPTHPAAVSVSASMGGVPVAISFYDENPPPPPPPPTTSFGPPLRFTS